MKKFLSMILFVVFLGSLVSAQILENFDTKGSLGIYAYNHWGSPGLIDSIYQTTDPTGHTPGVLGVALDLKGTSDLDAIGLASAKKGNVSSSGAQALTMWVYLPDASIPDSVDLQLYYQPVANGAYTWTSTDYYAKDIPKGVWYPLSMDIEQLSISDPTGHSLPGKNDIGDFGVQFVNAGNSASAMWKGVVYVDSVGLVGAYPTIIQDFKSSIGSFAEQWNNGWKDSVYWASGPTQDGAGVFELKDGSASTAWTSFGDQPSGSGVAAQGQFQLVFWVYIDSTFPDTFDVQTWAQSDPNWDWPSPEGPQTYSGKSIPKNKWYPIYFDLAQASAIDSVSGSFFNTMKNGDDLRKLGIQVGGPNGATWAGKVYIKNVSLINYDVPAPAASSPKWIVADFSNSANGGLQGFYVPSYAYGSVKRYDDILKAGGYVLQGNLNVSSATPVFAAVRDSIPMEDAADSIATEISFNLYMPSNIPSNGVVKFFVTGGPGDSIAVSDTIGLQIQTSRWDTLRIVKLDSLAQAGKFDPTKPSRVGVVFYYPGSLDTTQWTGNVEFDNLTVYGIWFGNQALSGVDENGGVVKQFELYQNYPNPFNPSTTIRYDVQKQSQVMIRIYDVLGRDVATLVNENQRAGSYQVEFNASRFSSGVYFVRMEAGSYIKTQRIMLIK
jgi:Secretion system C-terminal sorting domain